MGERVFPHGIPGAEVESQLAKLSSLGGDFDAMVRDQCDRNRVKRLNPDRVGTLSAGNPSYETLMEFQCGVGVFYNPGWKPNPVPPNLRPAFVHTSRAVELKWFELVQEGLAFVLPLEVMKNVPGFSCASVASWAPAQDKLEGRPILDGSARKRPENMLNGTEVATQCEEAWGKIELPTIVQVVEMVLELKDQQPSRSLEDVEVWKMDLKGAFTLLSFQPEVVKHFAVQVTKGLVFIFLCGVFGWTGMPFAFAVVSRAIEFELTSVLGLLARVYVDDIIAVGWKENSESDRGNTKVMCCKLLGKGAISDKKTCFTTRENPRIVVLGYCIDMHLLLLTLSERNFRIVIYGFFSIEFDRKVMVRVMEQLASYASRYDLICTTLRPFSKALHASYQGHDRHGSVILSNAAKWSIRLWRTILVLTRLREATFARSLESFRRWYTPWVIQFDSSLTGVGVWYQYVQDPGDRASLRTMGAGSVGLGWKLGGQSAFQNTCEFTGALLGVIGLIRHSVLTREAMPRGVCFIGDSVSALTWLDKKKHKGDNAFAAATLLTLILARYEIQVRVTVASSPNIG